MRRTMVGLTMLGGAFVLGGLPAGAQAQGCPESPQVCPPQVEEQPPSVGNNQPEVLGEGQVRQPPAQPRARSEVAANNSQGGLPVTGGDTMVLLASGAVLVAGGGGLVARSKRAGASASAS